MIGGEGLYSLWYVLLFSPHELIAEKRARTTPPRLLFPFVTLKRFVISTAELGVVDYPGCIVW